MSATGGAALSEAGSDWSFFDSAIEANFFETNGDGLFFWFGAFFFCDVFEIEASMRFTNDIFLLSIGGFSFTFFLAKREEPKLSPKQQR